MFLVIQHKGNLQVVGVGSDDDLMLAARLGYNYLAGDDGYRLDLPSDCTLHLHASRPAAASLVMFADLQEWYEQSAWMREPGNPDTKLTASIWFEIATPEQRLEIMRRYCLHCGTKNPACHCWNDE